MGNWKYVVRRGCAWGVVAVCLWVACFARGAENDAVKVSKGEVKVEYKTFDPKHLPEPPPPLSGKEAAVTVYRFGVESNVRYGYKVPANGARRPVTTTVELAGVEVRLSLSITVWLPDNATAQLKAHEEGHRAIAEHYYEMADEVARRVAGRYAGKKISIEGKDVEGAAKEEIGRVNKELCDAAMKGIEGPCGKAQDIYDRITDHGRKVPPTSEEAVKQAIGRAEKGD